MRTIALLLALICLAGCGATIARFTGGPFQEFPVYGPEREPRFDGVRVLSWDAGRRSVAEVADFYREELGGAGWIVRDQSAIDSAVTLIAEAGAGKAGYVISIRQGSNALCADASAIYVSVRYNGEGAAGGADPTRPVSASARPLRCDGG